MAITRLNNNSITSITALPSGVATGKVLNFTQTVLASSAKYTNSSSLSDVSGTEVSITPSSSSNKIWYVVDFQGVRLQSGNTNGSHGDFRVFRKIGSGSYAELDKITNGHGFNFSNSVGDTSTLYFTILDSPSTTDTVYYKVQFACQNGGELRVNVDGQERSSVSLAEIEG